MAFPADYSTLDTDITDATTTDNVDAGKDHATVHNEVHGALNDLAGLLTTTGDLATFDGTNWVRITRASLAADSAFRIQTKEQALTDATTAGTTVQQWGTEELTFNDADFGASVCVEAHLYGHAKRTAVSQAARQGNVQLQVSFDGGSTWADMSTTEVIVKWELVTGTTTWQANNRITVATGGVAVGSPTGDIQVRARVTTPNATGDPVFESGRIIATCRNSNAGDG